MKRSDHTRRVVYPISLLMVTACFGAARPSLPECQAVDQESTGDLSVDLVGEWKSFTGQTPTGHPIDTYIGTAGANRVWRFNADGSGYTWALAAREDADYYDEGSFTWRAEGDQLFIGQLRPLVVEMVSPDTARISGEDPSSDAGILNRCRIEGD